MADVQLQAVQKSFNETTVIPHVDLIINDGEFVVFVGPSGCGKSTLLRMVSGLEEINSGTIHIDNIDVTNLEPADRGVAMVFQSYALYPHMSVQDNMGFGLKMNGVAPAEIAKRVQQAANILELAPLLNRKPAALSGGQRQRVAIGRAIVRQPKVFLFDEPLSNLDAELRVAMRLEIKRLHKELAATMIYVTHDQVEAMTLADKIVVLRDGKIEQVGSPLELYDNPVNTFVAGFIGSPSMNFFDAEVLSATNNNAQINIPKLDNTTFALPLKTNPLTGSDFKIGVRPEHLSNEGSVSLQLSVAVAEHLGGTSYLYASSQNGQTVVLEAKQGRNLSANNTICVAFEPEQVFLFDSASQRVY